MEVRIGQSYIPVETCVEFGMNSAECAARVHDFDFDQTPSVGLKLTGNQCKCASRSLVVDHRHPCCVIDEIFGNDVFWDDHCVGLSG